MTTLSSVSLLFPHLVILKMVATETELFLSVHSTEPFVPCSKCGTVSQRIHSSYLRHVQDTPIGLFIVWLQITVRRFRCDNPECYQKTFAEQHPDFVARRRRRTKRLLHQLEHIGLALGGAAGARLTSKLAMRASGSTLLRLLHQMETPLPEKPRVIGIDEWAFRKGGAYGTIIIDHESGRPIDLLPNRDSQTVQVWLKKYPSVEIVTRDRSGEYREAITETLPEAMQVADRWHLLKNLGETIQRYCSKHRQAIHQLVVVAMDTKASLNVSGQYRRYAPGPSRETLQKARQEERKALFAAVKARHTAGFSNIKIARELGLSHRTVGRWMKGENLPPDRRGGFKRKCLIDEYVPYLQQRIEAGCRNKSQLWREIKEQGFTGTRTIVGKWVRQNYNETSVEKVKWVLPTSRKLAWLLTCQTDDLEGDKKQLLEILLQDKELVELRQAAREFN